MRRFLHENCHLRKCLTKTKERIIEIIQLFSATMLQLMSEEKRKKWKNTMMFESVNVKNSNARTFMIFHINDTTSFANIFISKSLFEFESFLKVESEALTKTQTKEKNSKKKFEERKERTLWEDNKEASKWVSFFFLFEIYINRFFKNVHYALNMIISLLSTLYMI